MQTPDKEAGQGSTGPLLPASNAFVLQLCADASQGHFAGRVEHLVSGESTRFSSVDDMLAFVTRVLGDVAGGDASSSHKASRRHNHGDD